MNSAPAFRSTGSVLVPQASPRLAEPSTGAGTGKVAEQVSAALGVVSPEPQPPKKVDEIGKGDGGLASSGLGGGASNTGATLSTAIVDGSAPAPAQPSETAQKIDECVEKLTQVISQGKWNPSYSKNILKPQDVEKVKSGLLALARLFKTSNKEEAGEAKHFLAYLDFIVQNSHRRDSHDIDMFFLASDVVLRPTEVKLIGDETLISWHCGTAHGHVMKIGDRRFDLPYQ